jgi:hypothetical protein
MTKSDIWRGYVNDSTGEVVFVDGWSPSKVVPPEDTELGGTLIACSTI